MRLPTQAEVNTAARYATSIVGTAITIFGLQAKGFSLDQAKEVIQALGSTVNSVVILLSALAPIYALVKGVHTSSPVEQSKAVAATGALVVTSPEIAAATPAVANIVSNQDVKVVSK